MRKMILLAVMLPTFLGAQQVSQIETLHARMNTVAQAEDSRQKAGFCKSADNTMAINKCLSGEMEKSQANYLDFVRALGAFLRLTQDRNQPVGAPQRIPFDNAEAMWLSYREKTCDVVRQGFSGGTGAPAAYGVCFLTVTGNHLQELHSLFSANY